MTWIPVTVVVDDLTDYGPYPAEVQAAHSRTHVWECPRFTRETVGQIIADHTPLMALNGPDYRLYIQWDGADILITRGRALDFPGEERISPDADGRYRILHDWMWTLHTPEPDDEPDTEAISAPRTRPAVEPADVQPRPLPRALHALTTGH